MIAVYQGFKSASLYYKFQLIIALLNPLRGSDFLLFYPRTLYGVIQIKPLSWFEAYNPERIKFD